MQDGVPRHTIERYLRVDRRKIAFLRFILEAYEGVAILTTLDARQGIVRLHIAPGCERDVVRILDDIRQDALIEAI